MLADAGFRRYLAARFLATLAIQMLGAAVAFQVWLLRREPLDLGLLGLSQFLPIALLSLFAGHVADRFDRRLVLLASDVLFALGAAALVAVSLAPSASVRWFFAIFVALGIGRAFYGPSGTALLSAVVPREHLAGAVAWQSTSWQLAAIAGPAAGGGLYAAAGPVVVHALSAAGFAVAALLVWTLSPRASEAPAPAREPPREAFFAGVRYVRRTRLLLGSITLDFFAVFLGGATALIPVYATEVLGVGAFGAGALRAAPGVGAGVAALWLAVRPLSGRAGPRMLAGVALFGAATIAFGLSRSTPLSLAALFVLGAADMVSAVVRGTLLQQVTPDRLRGRVSAVNLVFIGASNELGEFESGTLAAWIGAVPCVVAGGVGTLVVVAAWLALFPELRRIDRLEDLRPDG